MCESDHGVMVLSTNTVEGKFRRPYILEAGMANAESNQHSEVEIKSYGEFSVKSANMVARKQDSSCKNNGLIGGNYGSCLESLQCRKKLNKRIPAIHPYCPLCEAEEEDIHHLQCHKSGMVWFGSTLNLRTD